MATRKGMMKGKGRGYKNVVGKDPMVHSQSAKGIKQPQRIPHIPKEPPKPKLNDEEKEAMEIIGRDDFLNLKSFLESEYSAITGFREEEDGVWNIETEGEEFLVFENEERAERFAEDRVRQDLEDSPEMFTQSWLENFITMTDTDRRIIAGEEADNQVDNMDDDEVIEESEYKEEYDGIQDGIDAYENKFEDGLCNENEQRLQDKIDALESEKEELIDKAKEDLRSDKYYEIYDALEDPVNYFVDEQGMYSKEDLLKQSFIHIDIDEATEDAVRTDGWQHFVATYDGDSEDIPNTDLVMVRTN